MEQSISYFPSFPLHEHHLWPLVAGIVGDCGRIDSWAWTRLCRSLLWSCQPPKLLCQKSWSRQIWGKTWLWCYLRLFSLDVLCCTYTFRDGAVLSLLAFKLNWAGYMPGGKDCSVSITNHSGLFHGEAFPKDVHWEELVWPECLGHCRLWLTAPWGLDSSRFCKLCSLRMGKDRSETFFVNSAQDHVKLVLVAARTPQTRLMY